MREHYVSPPLVGTEARSLRAAEWRFRLLLGLAIAALVGGLVYLGYRLLAQHDEGSPSVSRPPGAVLQHPSA